MQKQKKDALEEDIKRDIAEKDSLEIALKEHMLQFKKETERIRNLEEDIME